MSTGSAFKQSLHFMQRFESKNLFGFFQLRNFKVGFSGAKTFRGFRTMGPSFCGGLVQAATAKSTQQSCPMYRFPIPPKPTFKQRIFCFCF